MEACSLDLCDFVEGPGFGEAPRWYSGSLWVSDIVNNSVLRGEVPGSGVP